VAVWVSWNYSGITRKLELIICHIHSTQFCTTLCTVQNNHLGTMDVCSITQHMFLPLKQWVLQYSNTPISASAVPHAPCRHVISKISHFCPSEWVLHNTNLCNATFTCFNIFSASLHFLITKKKMQKSPDLSVHVCTTKCYPHFSHWFLHLPIMQHLKEANDSRTQNGE
jgi:hypothetical protein